MKWLKKLWLIFKSFFSRKSTMKLPTIKNPSPPPADLIDKKEIPYVFIWIGSDGSKYIGIVLDGYLYKLNWTLSLEFWLTLSNIILVWLPSAPYDLEFTSPENVINIPPDLPRPESRNYTASNKP